MKLFLYVFIVFVCLISCFESLNTSDEDETNQVLLSETNNINNDLDENSIDSILEKLAEKQQEQEKASLASYKKKNNITEKVDPEYIKAILAQDELQPIDPHCEKATDCNTCLSNRKCSYCATTKVCFAIPEDGGNGNCDHSWQAFWPAGAQGPELISKLCGFIISDYDQNPPKSRINF
eukprot:c21815_g3_i1.p1 GENE.c21815_g3_i1~~c21815_g3_i1.p1  ORF type:complete len:179 (+),score=72.58 c21815_g3_i1:303-839(+)